MNFKKTRQDVDTVYGEETCKNSFSTDVFQAS